MLKMLPTPSIVIITVYRLTSWFNFDLLVTVPPPAPSGSSFGLLTTCLSLLLVFAGLSDLL